MAPSYWPSAQAADWQRPPQPNPYSHAVYAPVNVNGLMQFNVRGPNTPVGPGQATYPIFAGFVSPPPPPAPRDNRLVSGYQSGATQARTAWSHQRLSHLQHAHPVLGQHSHQQQTLLRPAKQPSNHMNVQQPKANRAFSSRPFFPGSPRGSSTSSGTADLGEASDVSSVTSSSQTSIAGEYFCQLMRFNKQWCPYRMRQQDMRNLQ